METNEGNQGQVTIRIDNERVRIAEWRFGPGEETGHHRHEFDYVVVPMSTGKLKITQNDGSEAMAELETGIPYFRNAGVEHNVINANPEEFAFIEIELK